MAVAMLSDYVHPDALAYTKYLSYALFVFPIYCVLMNFLFLKERGYVLRAVMPMLAGILFFVLGYITVLFLTHLRILLGLRI
jgi:hypothetical protein